jgi:hypothetical protein
MNDDGTMESFGFVEGMEAGRPARGSEERGGTSRFYGKYRGTVKINKDPEQRGRVMLEVPDVYGPNLSTWARPCLPYAGLQLGMYVVPPVNAGVWVEFEQGDPDYPIWTGCWWGSTAEVPVDAATTVPAAPVFLIGSLKKSTIALTDTPFAPLKQGGILLRASPTSYIAIEADGVTIVAPKILVTGVTNVNSGALMVTL